jgi:hypothetical protein
VTGQGCFGTKKEDSFSADATSRFERNGNGRADLRLRLNPKRLGLYSSPSARRDPKTVSSAALAARVAYVDRYFPMMPKLAQSRYAPRPTRATAALAGGRINRGSEAGTMTSAVSVFGHKSEFDPFLFAPVGEERNGMLLSVLSALARLEVD